MCCKGGALIKNSGEVEELELGEWKMEEGEEGTRGNLSFFWAIWVFGVFFWLNLSCFGLRTFRCGKFRFLLDFFGFRKN